MIFIIIVFYIREGSREGTTLHFGNINVISNFLGKEKPMKWKIIALRLGAIFLFFSILFLCLKIKTGKMQISDLYNNLYMFVPILLGAINHPFIEELLFRGIILSRFSKFISENRSNYLQAVLFGLFHSQFIYMFISMDRGDIKGFFIAFLIQIFNLTVYTFLGWIFGRAAIETKGIAIPAFLHTAIVISIYLSKGLIY